MATAKFVPATQRAEFKRILSQLDRTKNDKKILKIVAQVTEFLAEKDIGWDAVSIVVPKNYVLRSQRNRVTRDANAVFKATHALNGNLALGRDGRALLKMAVIKHPDWAVVKEALAVDIVHIKVADLIAIAQLLKIDARFIEKFADLPDAPELPLENGGDK